jgi:prefoldin subunit 5
MRGKIKTLEENVAKMKKLKDELAQSISALTQQMASLNLDGKD